MCGMKAVLPLIFLPFLLVGCSLAGLGDSFSYIEATVSPQKAESVPLVYHDFYHQVDAGGRTSLPPFGKSRLLVVPIEFDDHPFEEGIVASLDSLYNDPELPGYPSVARYYKESSYGQKELEFDIAPVYETGLSLIEAFEAAGPRRLSSYLLPLAVSSLGSEVDLAAYDGDRDGFIDGTILVYSAPDYLSFDYGGSLTEKQINELWAYTYYQSGAVANPDSPAPNAHSWIAASFMEKGKGLKLDPHTFIHETGHLFGLDDYYSNDRGNADSDAPLTEANRAPTGMLDMMDYGILDHSAFSKFAIGWASPYVIDESLFEGKDEITVELLPFVSSGDFLVIPAAGHPYRGHAFDEYILVEFYAPTGLNGYDAGRHYQDGYPNGYSMPGVKIYHVDARMKGFGANCSSSNVYMEGDPLDIDWEGLGNPINGYFDVAASNTYSYSAGDYHAPLLHLLEAEGKLTFWNQKAFEGEPLRGADNRTLFYPDEKHSRFDMRNFSSFFFREGKDGKALLNRGEEWGYSLTVNGIRSGGDSSVSITIERSGSL